MIFLFFLIFCCFPHRFLPHFVVVEFRKSEIKLVYLPAKTTNCTIVIVVVVVVVVVFVFYCSPLCGIYQVRFGDFISLRSLSLMLKQLYTYIHTGDKKLKSTNYIFEVSYFHILLEIFGI